MDSDGWERVSDNTATISSWEQVSEPWDKSSVSSGSSLSRSFADVVRSHRPRHPPVATKLPPFAQRGRVGQPKQSDDGKSGVDTGELNAHLLDGESEFAVPASIHRPEHGRGAHSHGHSMSHSCPCCTAASRCRRQTAITNLSNTRKPVFNSTLDDLMKPEPVTNLELLVGQRVDMPLSTNKKGRWEVASQLADQAEQQQFVKAHPHTWRAENKGKRGAMLDQTVVTLDSIGVIVPDKRHVKAAVEAAKEKRKQFISDPNVVYRVDSKNGRTAQPVFDLRGAPPAIERRSRRLTPDSMRSNVPVTKGCSLRKALVWKQTVNSCWRPINNNKVSNCLLDIDLGSECAVTGFSTLPRRPFTRSFPTTDDVKDWGFRDLASYKGPIYQNVLLPSFRLEAIEKYELLFRVGGGHDWVSIGVFEGHSSAPQQEEFIATERYHDLTNTQDTAGQGVVCRHLRVRPLAATKPFSARVGIYGYSLSNKTNKNKALLDSSAVEDDTEEERVRCLITSEPETRNNKYTQHVWRGDPYGYGESSRGTKKREALAEQSLP